MPLKYEHIKKSKVISLHHNDTGKKMKQTKPINHRIEQVQKVVEGVISGEPILRISENLGMSRGKIYRLLYGQSGQDILSTCYVESLDRLTYHLPDLISKAIATLDKAMTGRTTTTEVLAAKIVLERFDRISELLKADNGSEA